MDSTGRYGSGNFIIFFSLLVVCERFKNLSIPESRNLIAAGGLVSECVRRDHVFSVTGWISLQTLVRFKAAAM